MFDYAERTGVLGGPETRYLWTDAFAVCNFLGMASHDERARGLALRLVDAVHHTLGRHRPDDPRRGWISGLPEAKGEQHPTAGGLRIGKPYPELAEQHGPDPLEWDRDGQYFHYLTKWMWALDRVAHALRQPHFNRWARELAQVAFDRFSRPKGGRQLAWKMSIDLARPVVPSAGQHDALDGFLTFSHLRTTAEDLGRAGEIPDLSHETEQLEAMIDPERLVTEDPLGIGELLVDAWRRRLVTVRVKNAASAPRDLLLEWMLESAVEGLRAFQVESPPHRLAFRELGLCIGMRAIESLEAMDLAPSTRSVLGEVRSFEPLSRATEVFWLEPAARGQASWFEHRDINEVMLATALAPEGFLGG